MKKLIFCIAIIGSILASCEKPPGEGGSSMIQGKTFSYIVDGNGDTLNSYYAADKEVFISYGSEEITPDDRVWSGPSGDFKFSHLTAGTYQVFVYSYCETCPGKEEALVQEVTIAEDKTTVTMDDIDFSLLVE